MTQVKPDTFVRIPPGALAIGRPLPWTVYDAQGQVLLRQGYVIQSESQLEHLFHRGRVRLRRIHGKQETPASDKRERNPFAEYGDFLHNLEATLNAITGRQPSVAQRLAGLTRMLARTCTESPDASLALVHLYSTRPTMLEQVLFHAILCQHLGQVLELETLRLQSLTTAAFAANLPLLAVADQLNASPRLLNEQQREVLRKHPERTVQALQRAGFEQAELLQIIVQHHEHFDGSGYPQGLSGDAIRLEAQILALAERYVAMVTKRAYRERLSIRAVQERLRKLAGRTFHPDTVDAMLQIMGDYPPGVLVRLANQETGVVTRSGAQGRGVVVMTLFNPGGQRYGGAFERDTRDPEFGICRQEEPEQLPSMDFSLLWGFRN